MDTPIIKRGFLKTVEVKSRYLKVPLLQAPVHPAVRMRNICVVHTCRLPHFDSIILAQF